MELAKTALLLLGRTWNSMLRGRLDWRETIACASYQTWGSFAFVMTTLVFIGALGIYQGASQMARLIPEYSVMGPAFLQLMTREMGPVMTGLLVSIKVGTGLAAEVGAMNVTDQLDAMRLCGASPDDRVLGPRVLAAVLSTFCLCAMGVLFSMLAGAAVANLGFDVSLESFFSTRFIKVRDLEIGLIKTLVFGFTVPVVSIACGLVARGGSESVGDASTRAVVNASFSVIVLDLVIGAVAELLA